MCLGTTLVKVNREIISFRTVIKHFNRFSLSAKVLRMGVSHLNGLCFFSWSFSELLHEALLHNFLSCTATSGPYLVNNRKGFILNEQNVDHGKIFKWWSRGSHCAH